MPSVSGGFRVFGDYMSENFIVYSYTERNKLDYDIYQANLTNGKSKLVLQGKMGLSAHSVSPNGRHIVISERVGEDSDNLFRMLLSGTAATTYDVIASSLATTEKFEPYIIGAFDDLVLDGPYFITQLIGVHINLSRALQTEYPLTNKMILKII